MLAATRTTTATPHLNASSAVQTLTKQGAISTPTTPASTAAFTERRAFTFGGEGSMNGVISADGRGTFSEIGAFVKVRYNIFLDDKTLTEKDGLTYINVTSEDNGLWATEAGFRFRVSQPDEQDKTVTTSDGLKKTTNVSDLLLIEALYQHDPAMAGVLPSVLSQHRFVFRALAYSPVQPTVMNDALKFAVGIETSQDFSSGRKMTKVFYGANINLKSLFSSP